MNGKGKGACAAAVTRVAAARPRAAVATWYTDHGPEIIRGRNGFDGITGQKMRAEDHGLVKNMELKLTADQPLALAA